MSYTFIVARGWLLIALLGSALAAQDPKPQPKPEDPPEEDESLAVKEYSFNPLQAAKEITIGSFYVRKGSHRAAALRFEEAVKWNPGSIDAWLLLGESREKLKEMEAARLAYAKFLDLAPADKRAPGVRRKLSAKP